MAANTGITSGDVFCWSSEDFNILDYVSGSTEEILQQQPNKDQNATREFMKLPAQPFESPLLTDVIQIASGSSHLLAVTYRGDVFSWGEGRFGQLGHNNKKHLSEPTRIESLADERIVQVACGSSFSVAVSDSEKVYIWGNRVDCLNYQKFLDRYLVPTEVQELSGQQVVQVVCGPYHIAALMRIDGSNEVFVWGNYINGKGGYQENSVFPVNETNPTRLSFFSGKDVIQLAAAQNETIALTKNGQVYHFGGGVFPYKDSDMNLQENAYIPQLLPPIPYLSDTDQVVSVACADFNVLLSTKEGKLYSCYDESYFENEQRSIKFKAVIGLQNHYVQSIASFKRLALAITDVGRFFSFQVGSPNDRFEDQSVAKQLIIPKVSAVKQIACGGDMNAILTSSGVSLGQDLMQHFNNPQYSDITFIVEDELFYAHKVVLGRCQRLKDIMNDNKNEIVISDISWNSWGLFMLYIYTDMIDCNCKEDALELLKIAEQYSISHLENACRSYLGEILNENNNNNNNNNAHSDFHEYYCNLVNNKEFSDATFTIEDKEFYAHKVILACRVPFFDGMFSGNFKEGQSKNANIVLTEVDPVILQHMMNYIYTGKCIAEDDSLVPLLQLAHMYQMSGLKSVCVARISLGIDENNVFWLLDLAVTMDIGSLEHYCIYYLARYEVINQVDIYRQFESECKQLSDKHRNEIVVAAESMKKALKEDARKKDLYFNRFNNMAPGVWNFSFKW